MSSNAIVVDASLAVKWVEDEPYSAQARALLGQWHHDDCTLLAPALFLYEVTNVLGKRLRRRQLTLEQAKERLHYFHESGPVQQQISSVHSRSLELTERFGFSSAYDAHYLALAGYESCECWTADERLWNTVRHQLSWVRWIGES